MAVSKVAELPGAQIGQALRILFKRGDVVELRIPKSERGAASGYFNDLQALAKQAAVYDGHAQGIYITLNPVNPALLARANNRIRTARGRESLTSTSDADILCRRWLPIDFDPRRPADISSTDAEHKAALDRAREAREWLRGQGWPEPVFADSGNGAHLLYRIDLPNDDEARKLVERCLKAIAFIHADEVVDVDVKVGNAARIWKLYGTLSCKGDNLPERPHRRSAILEAPERPEPVSRELLERLAGILPEEPKLETRRTPESGKPLNIEAWISEHGLNVSKVKAWNGGTVYELAECPFNSDHRRSAHIVQFASGAVSFGCFHNSCQDYDWHALRDLLEPGWKDRGKKRTQDKRKVEKRTDATLPVIDAGQQDLQIITDQALKALLAANADNPRIFLHGGPVRIEADNETGHIVAKELTPDRLRHELARVAIWLKFSEEGEHPAKPPWDVVRDILATPGLPFPVLNTITAAPVYSPNGILETAEGYHVASKTYYAPPPGCNIPPVAANPSKRDVERARNLILLDLLADFPFAEDSDRAHAVGLLLLPFVRPMIRGCTPLHLIEASSQGAGKGLLASVLVYPALGRSIGIIPPPRDDEELRKALTARLREGRHAVLLDNVYTLNSAILAAALTAEVWDDRLLGKNETVTFPIRWVWIATGNNAIVSTDIARRSVRIRLMPAEERPWLREDFKHPDLRGWTKEHRGELIWAALTLIQAWIAAGKPAATAKPLGSFEEWTRVIGGILEYAGISGFLANALEFYDTADIEGTIWRQFVNAWWEKFRDQPVKVSDLFPLAVELDGFDLGKGATERAQKTAFGMKLARQRDRIFGDYRIEAAGTYQRAQMWRLNPTVNLREKVHQAKNPCGTSVSGHSQDENVNLCEPSGAWFRAREAEKDEYGAYASNTQRTKDFKGTEGEKVHQGSQGSHAHPDTFSEDDLPEEVF